LNEANELSLVQKIKNKVLKNKKGERKWFKIKCILRYKATSM
jgi:hypothetical protein